MGQLGTCEMKCDIPFVKGYTDRHGKQRFYYRRKGFPVVALPAPGSDGFTAAYEAAGQVHGIKPKSPTVDGSMGRLVLDYSGSAEFAALADSTRREMTYVLNVLVAEHGGKPIGRMEKRHILEMRDKLRHKPGAANKLIRTMKTILNWAAERGWIKESPAAGIKMMKLGRWRAWTDPELAQFEEKWKLGTLERVAFDLALYTSQRSGDQTKIRWDQLAGKKLPLVQQKTGKRLVLRLHEKLLASLAAWRPKCKGGLIISQSSGAPYSDRYFRLRMAKAITDAGLPDDCVWHGLRKTGARVLAELGVKSKPVTGHMTDNMQAEYEADADQERMAKGAILRWEKAERGRKGRR